MQFFDILNILPSLYCKILFLLTLFSISLWVYIDGERRGFTGYLWAFIIFLYPVILPVYILIRPAYNIKFCKKCRRILPSNSDDCYFCRQEIPLGKDKDNYPLRGFWRSYGYHFFLVVFRTLYSFLSLKYFYKKRFLPLVFKLSSFYSLGRAHQIVITEGKELDMPLENLTYGETSFYSAAEIFSFVEMKKEDFFYDLGSGTGNIVFFANILYHIEAVGIDAIPAFIDHCNRIKKDLSFDKVTFIKGNFFEEDLRKGTVFFIVTTLFSSKEIKKLTEKFKKSRRGTKIITVSRKLKAPYLKLKGERNIFFSWGFENVYLHVRT